VVEVKKEKQGSWREWW